MTHKRRRTKVTIASQPNESVCKSLSPSLHWAPHFDCYVHANAQNCRQTNVLAGKIKGIPKEAMRMVIHWLVFLPTKMNIRTHNIRIYWTDSITSIGRCILSAVCIQWSFMRKIFGLSALLIFVHPTVWSQEKIYTAKSVIYLLCSYYIDFLLRCFSIARILLTKIFLCVWCPANGIFIQPMAKNRIVSFRE